MFSYHRILEEFDLLPEYYCSVSIDLFGFSFQTSAALVNPSVVFMMYRYENGVCVCVRACVRACVRVRMHVSVCKIEHIIHALLCM